MKKCPFCSTPQGGSHCLCGYEFLELGISPAPQEPGKAPLQEIASTVSMGCTLHDVEAFRADAKMHGFTGIEFRPDPALVEDGVPLYYDCYCTSPAQWDKYLEHCRQGSVGGSGNGISADHLAAVQERMVARYPRRK